MQPWNSLKIILFWRGTAAFVRLLTWRCGGNTEGDDACRRPVVADVPVAGSQHDGVVVEEREQRRAAAAGAGHRRRRRREQLVHSRVRQRHADRQRAVRRPPQSRLARSLSAGMCHSCWSVVARFDSAVSEELKQLPPSLFAVHQLTWLNKHYLSKRGRTTLVAPTNLATPTALFALMFRECVLKWWCCQKLFQSNTAPLGKVSLSLGRSWPPSDTKHLPFVVAFMPKTSLIHLVV